MNVELFLNAISGYVSANYAAFPLTIANKIINWQYYAPIAQKRYEELKQNMGTLRDYADQRNLTGTNKIIALGLLEEGEHAKEEWEKWTLPWSSKAAIDIDRIINFMKASLSPEFYAAQMGAAAGKIEAELLHLLTNAPLRIPSVYNRRR